MGHPATPSKACQPCRVKRRKCDLKRPACTQCLRASVQCTGYRDQFSLRHRNQNQATVLKAKGIKKNSPPSEENGSSIASEGLDAQGETSLVQVPHPPQAPPNPIDVAIAYFLHAHAVTTCFNYLPEHFYTHSQTQPEHVITALSAPALVLFAQDFRQPSLLSLARDQYGKTLAYTNKALSSSSLVKQDETLLSVLLLSLFEALAFRGRRSPESWTTHIEGASTLLRIRGEKQFETQFGCSLFMHASGQIRVCCMVQGMSTPPLLRSLQKHATKGPSYLYLASKMGLVLDDHASLLATLLGVLNGSPPRELSSSQESFPDLDLDRSVDVDDGSLLANMFQDTPQQIISQCLERALAISDDIEDLLAETEALIPYEVVSPADLGQQVRSHGDRIIRYPHESLASAWVAMWISRLSLNELVYKTLSERTVVRSLDPDFLQDLRDKAFVRAHETVNDILCSVPVSLELSPVHTSSARMLIWPLAMIASSATASCSAKEFAMERLEYLGVSRNLGQASEAVPMIREKNNLDDWVHLTYFT